MIKAIDLFDSRIVIYFVIDVITVINNDNWWLEL